MNKTARHRQQTTRPQTETLTDAMVRCARCELHVPRKQALEKDGHFYCCIEHRDGDDTP